MSGARIERLIGQHPAALRSVWWDDAHAGADLVHLEVETKHGRVLVFDAAAPLVHELPPAPPGSAQPRCWRDLTEQIPEAFDGRPLITGVAEAMQEGRPCWRLELSTGVTIVFVPGETPLLLAL